MNTLDLIFLVKYVKQITFPDSFFKDWTGLFHPLRRSSPTQKAGVLKNIAINCSITNVSWPAYRQEWIFIGYC